MMTVSVTVHALRNNLAQCTPTQVLLVATYRFFRMAMNLQESGLRLAVTMERKITDISLSPVTGGNANTSRVHGALSITQHIKQPSHNNSLSAHEPSHNNSLSAHEPSGQIQ